MLLGQPARQYSEWRDGQAAGGKNTGGLLEKAVGADREGVGGEVVSATEDRDDTGCADAGDRAFNRHIRRTVPFVDGGARTSEDKLRPEILCRNRFRAVDRADYRRKTAATAAKIEGCSKPLRLKNSVEQCLVERVVLANTGGIDRRNTLGLQRIREIYRICPAEHHIAAGLNEGIDRARVHNPAAGHLDEV